MERASKSLHPKNMFKWTMSIFKKLTVDIWEFRTLYQGLHYRLLAFWDKTSQRDTLVIATHGFLKKRSKVPDNEIQKAVKSRISYFEDKESKNRK